MRASSRSRVALSAAVLSLLLQRSASARWHLRQLPASSDRGAGPAAAASAARGPIRRDAEDNHSEFKRPELMLTFTMSFNSTGSIVRDVRADAQRLAIAVHQTSNSKKVQDGTILDFLQRRQYMHQRFFEELVCFEMDLGGPPNAVHNSQSSVGLDSLAQFSVGTSRGQESETALLDEEAHEGFVAALGEVLGVPLELYDEAKRVFPAQTLHVASLQCEIYAFSHEWLIRQQAGGGVPSMSPAKDASFHPHSAVHAMPALPEWFFRDTVRQWSDGARTVLAGKDSNVAGDGAEVALEVNVTFCVSEKGELLAANSSRRAAMRSPIEMPILESLQESFATSVHARPSASDFVGTRGVTGRRCVDLTRGNRGPRALHDSMNDAARLERINVEAAGQWETDSYRIWDGMTVNETVSALGTEIKPLGLELSVSALGAQLAIAQKPTIVPRSFDARKRWPECLSIGTVRSQGECGACWAFASTSVLADRICISMVEAGTAASSPRGNPASTRSATSDWIMHNHTAIAAFAQVFDDYTSPRTLSLSPGYLVDCDEGNAGCSGGRLDDAWRFLRDHGVPMETCSPYRFCPLPNARGCGYGEAATVAPPPIGRGTCAGACTGGLPKTLFRASAVYAASRPGDVAALQRELMASGTVEVAFFVFSDFHSYRRGVYFRTPGAYGPLGGHAVRLVGWGVQDLEAHGGHNSSSVDYWLVGNSWSPAWGLGGFFMIRRGTNECGIETTPAAGFPQLG